MAIVVIQEIDAPVEQYDQVSEKLGDTPPDGLIVHAGIDLGDGKMKAVDIWESAERYQAWVQNELIPRDRRGEPGRPRGAGARDPRGARSGEVLS
jgi:hypothetical protein